MKSKIEHMELKGSSGFVFFWLALLIYSIIIAMVDWKVGVIGFLTCIMFGFLGFDMLGDLIDNLNPKQKRSKK